MKIASGVSCIIMGLISKYPVGLAPGMGMNALFTYTIILGMGNTWETALAAVFVSSIIFLLITISGLREAILNALPFDLKLAIGAGIGFFLAFIGLKGAGIIVADPATLVGMGFSNNCNFRCNLYLIRFRCWRSYYACNSCRIRII